MLAWAQQQPKSGRQCLDYCNGVVLAFWISSSLSPSKQCLSQGKTDLRPHNDSVAELGLVSNSPGSVVFIGYF